MGSCIIDQLLKTRTHQQFVRIIQQFIKRTKLGITSEYIDELEQLCMEKNKTSRLYASLLNMRDQELMAIRGQSSRLDGLWKMVEEQYERLRSDVYKRQV